MTNYRFQNYAKRVRIGKIICLARTYKEHAREMNTIVTEDPLLFLKPASSVIFNHETIVIPRMSQCLHHEVELGVIIGKNGKHITEEKALQHVLGYLVALDITARDIQSIAKKNGWPWGIAKGFDTFAPLSDAVLKERVPNPQNLDLELKINGAYKTESKHQPDDLFNRADYLIYFGNYDLGTRRPHPDRNTRRGRRNKRRRCP